MSVQEKWQSETRYVFRVFIRPPARAQAVRGWWTRCFPASGCRFSSVVLGSLDIALRKEPWLCRASACPAVVGMPGSMLASAKDALIIFHVAYL